jgi:hypothetical protein
MADPLVSVLLPVYNAEKYIAASIRSMLAQTYTNFELIIINDGSKDKSGDVIRGFDDSRIRYYEQENAGMGATLNRAITLAQGEFIARQDADDVSLPDRFAAQVTFLETQEEYGLVGARAAIVDENLKPTGRFHAHPLMHTDLTYDLLFDNPFVHSAVMMRKSMLDKIGPYALSKASLIQDYELWTRFARKFRVANLDENLVLYREVTSGMSQTTRNYGEVVAKQAEENISWLLGNSGEKLTPELCQCIREFCLLYHGAFSLLPKQPDRTQMRLVAKLIEQSVQQKWIDFNAGRAQIHQIKLAKHWRDYQIGHADTPAMKRFWLRLERKLMG